ncbi:hypothetical protein EYD45_12125 [Hyunsoonleella flava]|uniref:Outer membrane protein beta-barrel domain-containing protein n=1 Tax=Hyunsoonleella flava TaxID=2527939 RepID=A0A4Q9FF78_9FLAO|nr:hypothetical protein [Hyunsoonleella flava]TBN02448.1 hypothetical protein EYD45_12125 [Hyunsoonleella flava]
MNSIFHIKYFLFGIFSLIGAIVFAQELPENEDENNPEDVTKNDWQKLGFGAIEYVQPITTGDNNFFGLGIKGKSGFNIRAQLFVYEHIFVSATIGTSYFTVNDKSLVGNYNKTQVNHQYVNIGYEIIPVKNVRIGLSFSVFGQVDHENKSRTNTNDAFQIDDGQVRSYEGYIDYMLNKEFAICLNYSYRNDKMDIVSPPEIQSLFERASFHNIGVGVKLYFGQSAVFPTVFE